MPRLITIAALLVAAGLAIDGCAPRRRAHGWQCRLPATDAERRPRAGRRADSRGAGRDAGHAAADS